MDLHVDWICFLLRVTRATIRTTSIACQIVSSTRSWRDDSSPSSTVSRQCRLCMVWVVDIRTLESLDRFELLSKSVLRYRSERKIWIRRGVYGNVQCSRCSFTLRCGHDWSCWIRYRKWRDTCNLYRILTQCSHVFDQYVVFERGV